VRAILALLLALLARNAVGIGSPAPASVGLLPLPARLDSLYGPSETIPPVMRIEYGAMLRADDWVYGTVYFKVRFESTSVCWNQERFELHGGDSLLLDYWPFLTEPGQYEVKDSVVFESHADSFLEVTWDFRIGPRHHGGIGIARIVAMPFEVADTFWSITPEFVLANYGAVPDSGWAFVLFGDTGQGRVVYSESTGFRLAPGESVHVVSPAFRFHEVGPHYGSCGWRTDNGDADSLSWRFLVYIWQHGDIGVTQIVDMPRDTIDTLRTWRPMVKLKVFYMQGRDSVWLALRFSDTLSERIVYADSYPLVLEAPEETLVVFRAIRFNVPGPYHGQLAWHCMHGFSDSLDWDFWVDANLGVEDRSVPILYKTPATVIRGMLRTGDSRQNTGYRADLLDISGRKVMELVPGPSDVRHLAPGVYFVREKGSRGASESVSKVVVTR